MSGDHATGGGAGRSAAAGSGGSAGAAPSSDDECACPNSATATWIADPSCVYQGGVSCPTTLGAALGYLVAEAGGVWKRDCSQLVVGVSGPDNRSVGCVYDDAGALQGAFRDLPPECPGVAVVATTAGLDDSTCADGSACWLGVGDNPGYPPCTDAGDYLSPACVDYGQASLSEAFMQALGGEATTTLTEYLKSIVESDVLSEYSALIGCGFTAIRWYGLGSTTVVFDASGALVGFDLNGDSEYGPCRTSGYRRGVIPPDGCASGYTTCPIAPDVLDTGVVCASP